jgi:hypothetical protein
MLSQENSVYFCITMLIVLLISGALTSILDAIACRHGYRDETSGISMISLFVVSVLAVLFWEYCV